ncbi:MAG: Tm-1-like ATP-binding domain-containing protein [Paracoccaceae bacterium]|nr:Tm-1-like ATP-binding domain-containing protein [Paracoccaceae bacterium]
MRCTGGFACVMDFAVGEFGNLMPGSVVHAGPDRLLSAWCAGISQIVAPGRLDLIDFSDGQDILAALKGRPIHIHNKLISNVFYNAGERRQITREYNNWIGQSKAPEHRTLPNHGIEKWDRLGVDCYDPTA